MSGVWLNDVQTRLHATRAARVARPTSTQEVQSLVKAARDAGEHVSVAGGRHSMGGQQFRTGATHLDMTAMDQILALDRKAGIVTIQAGIQWPALIDGLRALQPDDPSHWSIIQKQTGANDLTLGGSLAANIHGRQIARPPISADVEAIRLVDAQGDVHALSRRQDPRLFSLALGGYGLVGVITEVKLRLLRHHLLQRVVTTLPARDFVDQMRARGADGFEYGDLQYAIDPASSDFLDLGVFSCYGPAPPDARVPADPRHLSADDWQSLAALAHEAPSQAFVVYRDHYLSTSGQIYGSDTHQLSPYVADYHRRLDDASEAAVAGCDVISELFVPRGRLEEFLVAARARLRGRGAKPVYGTIRLIERDEETFLAWARQDWACVVVNLHADHTPASLHAVAEDFRGLIDDALACGGSYFLPYHRWARREQVLQAHPRLADFLAAKLERDPHEVFDSEWYRHLRALRLDRR